MEDAMTVQDAVVPSDYLAASIEICNKTNAMKERILRGDTSVLMQTKIGIMVQKSAFTYKPATGNEKYSISHLHAK